MTTPYGNVPVGERLRAVAGSLGVLLVVVLAELRRALRRSPGIRHPDRGGNPENPPGPPR